LLPFKKFQYLYKSHPKNINEIIYAIIDLIGKIQFMASKKSPQSRFLGDLPMEGGITQKEKYRYVAHLMFFIGCALFSFGIWALSGFTASSGATGPFPF